MPSNKDFMKRLLKLEGAVTESRNPHLNVIQSPSPSLNFTFGNGQGLPRGYSMLLYGPPRGGKSVICNAMAGQMPTATEPSVLSDPPEITMYSGYIDTRTNEEKELDKLELEKAEKEVRSIHSPTSTWIEGSVYTDTGSKRS